MSLVRANSVCELLSRNRSSDSTPPCTPVQDCSTARSYNDIQYEQAFQQAQQQLSTHLGVLNLQHYKVNELTERNGALTEEIQSLRDQLETKTSVHAEQLERWQAFYFQQASQWACERVTLDAAQAHQAKELAELKLKHQEQRLQAQTVLARRKRKIDELTVAVRTSDAREKNTKILRHMFTLRGIEFGNLDRRHRELLKEKFQLQADLRFERKQTAETKTKLEESAETWRSKYETEQTAHSTTTKKFLEGAAARVELDARYENEKKERELYQKLCEEERTRYLEDNTFTAQQLMTSKSSVEQMKAGLVTALALAASVDKAREDAESRYSSSVKGLEAQITGLKREAAQINAMKIELAQSQANCKLVQARLTDATQRAAAEVRNRKTAEKQRGTAQCKVDQLQEQLAETAQEHQVAVEEAERLNKKFSSIMDVMRSESRQRDQMDSLHAVRMDSAIRGQSPSQLSLTIDTFAQHVGRQISKQHPQTGAPPNTPSHITPNETSYEDRLRKHQQFLQPFVTTQHFIAEQDRLIQQRGDEIAELQTTIAQRDQEWVDHVAQQVQTWEQEAIAAREALQAKHDKEHDQDERAHQQAISGSGLEMQHVEHSTNQKRMSDRLETDLGCARKKVKTNDDLLHKEVSTEASLRLKAVFADFGRRTKKRLVDQQAVHDAHLAEVKLYGHGLETELTKAEEQLQNTLAINTRLEAELGRLREERSEVKNSHGYVDQMLEEERKKFAIERAEHNVLRDKHRQLQKDHKQTQKAHCLNKGLLADAKSSCIRLENRIKVLEATGEEVKKHLVSESDDHRQTQQMLKVERKAFLTQAAELDRAREDLEAAQRELVSGATNHKALRTVCGRLGREQEQLESERDELRSKCEKVKAENAKLVQLGVETRRDARVACQEVEALRVEADQKRVAEIQGRLAAEKRSQEAEMRKKVVEEDMEALVNRLREAETKALSAQDRSTKAERRTLEVEQEKKELEKKLAAAREKAEEHRATNETLKRKLIKAYEDEITKLET